MDESNDANEKQVRAVDYFEVVRTRLSLVRSALVGVGHEPNVTALSAAIEMLGEAQTLVEHGLQVASNEALARESGLSGEPEAGDSTSLFVQGPGPDDSIN